MAGHRPWAAIRGAADADPERRRRVAGGRGGGTRVRAHAGRGAPRAFTQEQLAATLNVPQSQISRIEHQADLYLSTIARYIAAMGGRIEIIATFGDTGARVPLALTDLAPTAEVSHSVHA